MPPPVLPFLHLLLFLLSHTLDGNKSLISAAFLSFRVLRGEKRNGEERSARTQRRTIHATCRDYAPFPVEGGAGGKREQRPRMVLAKFNFASRHFYFSLISSDLFIAIKGHPSFFEGCFRSIVLLLRLLKYLIGITSILFLRIRYYVTIIH